MYMYMETKHYEDGNCFARLRQREIVKYSDHVFLVYEQYDYALFEIDKPEDWIKENLEIEPNDIVQLVTDLQGSDWVNISAYISMGGWWSEARSDSVS